MYYRSKFPVVLDYVNDLQKPLEEAGNDLPAAIIDGAVRVLDGYSRWFALEKYGGAEVVVALILLIAVCGWFARIRRLQPDAVFLAIYVGLVIYWPYPTETARLLAVTMPVVALCAWEGAVVLAHLTRIKPVGGFNSIAAVSVCALGIYASAPKWMDIGERMALPLDAELAQAKRSIAYFTVPVEAARYYAELNTRVAELIRAVPSEIDSGACVWAAFPPLAAYLALNRVGARLTPEGITHENLQIKLHGCRYILLTNHFSDRLDRPALYPSDTFKFGRPILYSEMRWNGEKVTCAVLLELRQ
jgi:hypothetical protein